MEKYSDTKESKVFNDPIHGHIELHPVLVKIINTPEFQRLRNIKQLGGVYFVYPGASHNRFEHSIGVAHLAGELAKALKVKQLEQIKPLEELKKLKDLESLSNEELNLLKKLDMCTWEELEKMKKLKSLKTDELEEWKKLKPEDVEKFEKLKVFNPEDLKTLNNSLISDRDVLCVQIAGLCHDIGHGPFSHLFDRMFMPEADKEDNGKWKHEDASIKMFDRLLGKENGLKKMMKECRLEIEENERDRWFIEELITGHPKELPDQDKRSQKEELDQDMWKYKGRDEEKSFLYEIVSNKGTGIDVDKFDYFARDCHHLGIRNNFDHKRFIMFARVCDVKEDRRKHICSRDKEVANLYDLFEQRHSIHRRACKHKIVLAVEIMIKDALVLVNDHPDFKIRFLKDSEEVMLSLSKAKEDMGAYIKLTDQVIERILYSESSSNEDNSQKEAREKARKIVQRVMDRDLYRCVGQAKNKDQMEISKEMEDNLKELVRKIPHDGEEKFVIIVLPLDYGKEDRDPMSKPFIYRSQKTDKGSPTSTSDKKYQVEISKKMEESFKKMVEDNPVGGEDKFVIIAVPLDYGKEDSGPMSKPYIYRTQNPDKQIPISESERKEKDEKKRKNLEKMKEELRKKLHISFSEVDNGKNDGEDHGEEDHGNDNFEVNIVTLDYGMENVDPISKAYFYCKDNPDGGIPISKSKVSKFLPEHFSEDKFMVYWKNHEELKGKDRDKKEKEVMGFFKTWCKENGFEDVEEDDGSGTTAAASNSRK